ncbi:9,11-endoperoxide prostaglandin H2 reductase-like [Hydractinia symbiolongicarpus]|uniref:9,11-endoperoxide prostaglandin H2 reductase-like n=1 Tax=Hydractinia symbiolongicarpus TaxID=13093 RepID=UPI00254E180E|nr:9,11-endoperoxide prostaglandin H2 reductase-like [Hydractinia symbiolongicarpus]
MDINSVSQRINLSDGNSMPLFGFGCWNLAPKKVLVALESAVKNGYCLFDTAEMYKNEEMIGKALKNSTLSRDQYFVVTKLLPSKHGYNEAKSGLRESLTRLGLDYVDLFLIHSPHGGKNIETWKAFVELKQEGLTKSIGVSNFNVQHLKGLMASGMESPAVNQIELHPWYIPENCVEYCRKHSIAVMGYCPLARARLFEDGKYDIIDNLSKKHQKTKAQLLLRWALQREFITIPKSANPERIKENSEIFDFVLSEDDMNLMSQLNQELHIAKCSSVMNEHWTG